MINWRKLLPSLPDYPDNPLFRYEIRQVRWAETPARLKRYTLIVFGLTLLVVILFWILMMLGVSPPAFSNSDRFLKAGEELFPLLIVISIGANVLIDLGSLLMTANSFVGEVEARRWDLLKLAALNSEFIVAGKYAVALCRTWRFTAIVLSLRAETLLVGIIVFWLHIGQVGEGDFSIELLDHYAALSVIALIFICEPYWRTESHTKELLKSSLGRASYVQAVLSGVPEVFALWFRQPFFFLALGVIAVLFSLLSLLASLPFSGGDFVISLLAVPSVLISYGKFGFRKPMRDLMRQLDYELGNPN